MLVPEDSLSVSPLFWLVLEPIGGGGRPLESELCDTSGGLLLGPKCVLFGRSPLLSGIHSAVIHLGTSTFYRRSFVMKLDTVDKN